jgi:hypothetical protein
MSHLHEQASEIDSTALPGKEGGGAMEEFQPVTYNYSFFHLIFALASCYIAMLMTGWGTGAEERDLIDVGWVSVWVIHQSPSHLLQCLNARGVKQQLWHTDQTERR